MAHDPTGQIYPTYYAATERGRQFYPPADQSISCDVCIIGGGFTGVSTALHLAEQGYDVCLIEAERLGYGASGRNGGQVFSGQRVDQPDLEDLAGKDTARTLWHLAEDAKSLVQALVMDHAIPCDLRTGGLQAATKPSRARELTALAEHIRTVYGHQDLRIVDGPDMPSYVNSERYAGGLWDARALHLHPLNYLLGVARAATHTGARIFEQTRALRIDMGKRVTIKTTTADFDCTFAVVACNGYLNDLLPELAPTILPINSFVGVTPPLGAQAAGNLIPSGGCVADTRTILDYYRLTADNRLLFGGGESYGLALPCRDDMARRIRKRIGWVFPALKDTDLDYIWGGRLAITLTRVPHFGRISHTVYFAQGFSGHGISIGTLAGRLIADAICGQSERFDIYAALKPPAFPGGTLLRRPLLVLAMLWAHLRDAF